MILANDLPVNEKEHAALHKVMIRARLMLLEVYPAKPRHKHPSLWTSVTDKSNEFLTVCECIASKLRVTPLQLLH